MKSTAGVTLCDLGGAKGADLIGGDMSVLLAADGAPDGTALPGHALCLFSIHLSILLQGCDFSPCIDT